LTVLSHGFGFVSTIVSSLRDRRLLEVNGRLCQDTAYQGRASDEIDFLTDQEDSLHRRTCVHNGRSFDRPEDVLRLCAARQKHVRVRGLREGCRYLDDEDVVGAALKGNV
jgi:hypothetical protein